MQQPQQPPQQPQQPPPVPLREADLDAWHVYADWLIDERDPRGELIALELALAAAPDDEALARFHRATTRLARLRATMPIGWCLAHVRTLSLGHPYLGVHTGELVNAADFLSTPIGSRVEQLSVRGGDDWFVGREWRRLARALPASCARLAVHIIRRRDRVDAQRLLDALPAAVQRLELAGPPPAPFVDDRLDELVLPDLEDGADAVEPLVEALARTRRVRLRIGAARGLERLRTFGDRVVIGEEGAARLDGADAVLTLPPASLLSLQRRFGLVPVRTQLARALSEQYSFERRPNGWLRVHAVAPKVIVRHRGGRFTVRASHGDRPLALAVNGVAVVGDDPRPLVDGDRLTLDASEWIFRANAGGLAP